MSLRLYNQKYYEILNIPTFTRAVEAPTKYELDEVYHRDDDFIRIGAICSGSYKNVRRPEQHAYNIVSGKLFFGSDARLNDIRIPSTTPFNSDSIFCRKCLSHPIIYSDSLSLAEKARSVEKMRTHEKKCKSKPKNQMHLD